MKKFYFSTIILMLTLVCKAQYSQNFDSLTDTGSGVYNNLPAGWGIFETGSGQAADGYYTVGNGAINTGNVYSFGLAVGDGERAFGTLSSGSNLPTIGAKFLNPTAGTITSITIAYTGEQWRYGGRSTGIKDSLRFEYSLDATGINGKTGTWTRVNELDFLSVISNTTDNAVTPLNGNAAENRQAITYTITDLNLLPGQSIVLRWLDPDIAGFDDGLSIDDFSISDSLTPGALESGGTLPIELTNLKGALTNDNAFLQWNTASEVNASHFIVEGSGSLNVFVIKGKVNAAGAGSYSFTDKTPVKGINYYRIKQVDKNGTFVYSKVILLKAANKNLLSIFPNPSRSNVRINSNTVGGEKLSVRVMDAAGNIVFNKNFGGGSPIDVNLSHLPAGTYIIRVNQQTERLIINK